MRFQPLILWWLVLPVMLAGFGFIGYQIFKIRSAGKSALLPWIRRAVLLLLLCITALGPSIPGGSSAPGVANLDVVFAVDTTASMGAQDYNGNKLRIDGIKQDVLALGAKLQGAHFAIVTFDSNATVALPFTPDSGTFTVAVQSINREIYGTSKGSSIDIPIDVITQQLKFSKTAHPERTRLLFYMGDGEQTTEQKVKPFTPLADYVQGGAVLGYGTKEGAKMQRYTGFAAPGKASESTQFVNTLDPDTKKFVPAVSKLDETALNNIASELKVAYQNRNQAGSVDEVYKTSKAQLFIDQDRRVTHYINLYWLFAIPLVLLLIWEWNKLVLLLIELGDLRKLRRGSHV